MQRNPVRLALTALLACALACGTEPEDTQSSQDTPDTTDTQSDTTPSDDTTTDSQDESRLTDGLLVRTVIDGDTIEVLRNDEVLRVRFKGIDTPELYGDAGPEAFAQDAKDFVWASIGNSKVELEFDSACGDSPFITCFDGYGRLLAYVRTEDYDDLAQEILKRGFGEVYRYQNEVFDRLGTYQAAEASAQRDRAGIWSN